MGAWGVLCQRLTSLHRESRLGPRGKQQRANRAAACPASSSPPPHLLTETRLLLFLTLQLPLAWGSPLHPTPTRRPSRVPPARHSESSAPDPSTRRGAADARAGWWGQQNKTVTAQPRIPPPRTLSEPVAPGLEQGPGPREEGGLENVRVALSAEVSAGLLGTGSGGGLNWAPLLLSSAPS